MKIFYGEDELPENIPVLTNCEPIILLKQLINTVNKNGANVKASDFKSVVILDEMFIDQIRDDIDLWIRENVREPSAIVLSPDTCRYHFYFMDEADALGFKLRWVE